MAASEAYDDTTVPAKASSGVIGRVGTGKLAPHPVDYATSRYEVSGHEIVMRRYFPAKLAGNNPDLTILCANGFLMNIDLWHRFATNTVGMSNGHVEVVTMSTPNTGPIAYSLGFREDTYLEAWKRNRRDGRYLATGCSAGNLTTHATIDVLRENHDIASLVSLNGAGYRPDISVERMRRLLVREAPVWLAAELLNPGNIPLAMNGESLRALRIVSGRLLQHLLSNPEEFSHEAFEIVNSDISRQTVRLAAQGQRVDVFFGDMDPLFPAKVVARSLEQALADASVRTKDANKNLYRHQLHGSTHTNILFKETYLREVRHVISEVINI